MKQFLPTILFLFILFYLYTVLFNTVSLTSAQIPTNSVTASSSSPFFQLTTEEVEKQKITEEQKYFFVCISIHDKFVDLSKQAIQTLADMTTRVDAISLSLQTYYESKKNSKLPKDDYDNIVYFTKLHQKSALDNIKLSKDIINESNCENSINPENFKDYKLQKIKFSIVNLASELDLYKNSVKNLLLSIRDGKNYLTISSSSAQLEEKVASPSGTGE